MSDQLKELERLGEAYCSYARHLIHDADMATECIEPSDESMAKRYHSGKDHVGKARESLGNVHIAMLRVKNSICRARGV